MAGIFKAYDIRGIYGRDLNEQVALSIGRAFVDFLRCRKVVVGRDMRPHSLPIFNALVRGITMQGADVISVGLCSTPMSYFANGFLKADASIMITASHNPAEWNGFKLCRGQAVPLSGSSGIADIEKIVLGGKFNPPAPVPGKISEIDILPEYTRHIKALIPGGKLDRPVKIAADFANSVGALETKTLAGLIAIDPLFEELDGSFPNHEANPLKAETLAELQRKIRSGQYDFGVAFDGDADRAGFVDEKGEIIPMDMITALVAQSILKKEKGYILYDLRSSWAVKEVIQENGGIPQMCRVGHAFIKQDMRKVQAIFAGEVSGHYYFRDNYYTESSSMAVLFVASLISRSSRPLSEMVAPLKRYFKSPEINSEVKDSAAVFKRLKETFRDGKVFELDGLSIEFPDWWFNVRASNTEPLVRLNLEARSQKMLNERQKEILEIIRG